MQRNTSVLWATWSSVPQTAAKHVTSCGLLLPLLPQAAITITRKSVEAEIRHSLITIAKTSDPTIPHFHPEVNVSRFTSHLRTLLSESFVTTVKINLSQGARNQSYFVWSQSFVNTVRKQNPEIELEDGKVSSYTLAYYRPQTKFGEGNVFTAVCLFMGVGGWGWGW